MAAELLLLRHAKSDWHGDAHNDHDRSLNARGRAAAPRMGRFMLSTGILPDRIQCSTARRTRETLRGLAGNWPAPITTQFDDAIYEASLGALLELLGNTINSAERVLLIGHNPGMDQLLRHLARPPLPEGQLFPTCALAQLRLDEGQPLAPQSAQLLLLQRVKALSE